MDVVERTRVQKEGPVALSLRQCKLVIVRGADKGRELTARRSAPHDGSRAST